jgi:myo-inositol-1(or 4)-monophosphatase
MQQTASVSHKSWHDLVTQADVASQKLIVDKILKKFPDHTIFAEEGMQDSDLYADNCWIIDPLDGTNNYAYGIPLWGVSIAYAQKGELVLGGIAYPNQGIILIAQKSKGAHEYIVENQKLSKPRKIQVSDRDKIEQAMVMICPAPHSEDSHINFQKVANIAKKTFSIRQFGAAVFEIGYTALGIGEVCLLFRLKPHDGAAGALIIREAKGRVTDLQGNEWKLDSPSFVGTNGHVHNKILEMLRRD